MRNRLLVLAVFFVLIVSFVGLSKPDVVQAACPVGITVCPPPPPPASNSPAPGIVFNDGRINNNDPWETSAIYCLGDGSVRVYVIGNPWHIAFTASPDAIISSRITQTDFGRASSLMEEEGIFYYFSHSSDGHTLVIAQGMGARLERLPNGMLQVTSPGLNPADGDYRVTFTECPGLPSGKPSRVVEVDHVRIADIIDINFGAQHGSGMTLNGSGRQGNGTNQSASTLTITKALSGKNDLFEAWRKQLLNGKIDLHTVALVYINGNGKEIYRLTFTNCYPVSWKLSGGNGGGGDHPAEMVQLSCLGGPAK